MTFSDAITAISVWIKHLNEGWKSRALGKLNPWKEEWPGREVRQKMDELKENPGACEKKGSPGDRTLADQSPPLPPPPPADASRGGLCRVLIVNKWSPLMLYFLGKKLDKIAIKNVQQLCALNRKVPRFLWKPFFFCKHDHLILSIHVVLVHLKITMCYNNKRVTIS